MDASGNVWVGDGNNFVIRMIVPSTGVVTTALGNGISGTLDGQGTSAFFTSAYGLAFDASGLLWVSDNSNDRVRVVNMTTLATATVGGAGCGFVNTAGSGSSTGNNAYGWTGVNASTIPYLNASCTSPPSGSTSGQPCPVALSTCLSLIEVTYGYLNGACASAAHRVSASL